MVYRSFVSEGPGSSSGTGGSQKRAAAAGPPPGGVERRRARERAAQLSQEEIFLEIARPNATGAVSCSTHLMVRHARGRGFAALAVQARYPLQALLQCQSSGVRAIPNHRLKSDSPAGHYSVLIGIDGRDVILHDPFYGPSRRVPPLELLELWQKRYPSSEIAGNVLIGIAWRPAPVPECRLCSTPIPAEVSCPRCGQAVSLEPASLLGCVGPGTCLERRWNYLCCPSCDNMWTFAMAPAQEEAARPSDGSLWNLGPLFAELDKFRDGVLAIPAVKGRADVKQQLDLIEENKEKLRLAESEEISLQQQRQAQLDAITQKYGQQAAAVRQAQEAAATPTAPLDGGALGNSLLKELGVVS